MAAEAESCWVVVDHLVLVVHNDWESMVHNWTLWVPLGVLVVDQAQMVVEDPRVPLGLEPCCLVEVGVHKDLE